jgi:hypothetical protein
VPGSLRCPGCWEFAVPGVLGVCVPEVLWILRGSGMLRDFPVFRGAADLAASGAHAAVVRDLDAARATFIDHKSATWDPAVAAHAMPRG